jgi:hypothetical protein
VRYDWPRSPLLMGLVLGPLAENRLFLSMDAFGLAWIWRPGVLVIAAVMVLLLALPRRHQGAEPTAGPAAWSAGEAMFAGGLLAVLTAAWIAAGSYAARPALMPRLAIGLTAIAIAIALLHTWRRAAVNATPHPRAGANGIGWWIPVFPLIIWALGFRMGVPLAISLYLVTAGRQRAVFAITAAAAAFLFLDVVLGRLLHVPFPPGVLLAWTGIGGA